MADDLSVGLSCKHLITLRKIQSHRADLETENSCGEVTKMSRNVDSIFAMVALMAAIALGCRGLGSSSSPSSGPPSGQQTQPESGPARQDQTRRDDAPDRTAGNPNPFPNDQPQQAPAANPNAGGDNGDPSVLYGSWVSDATLNGMQCHAEYIYESTGTYSSLGTCGNAYGSYMTRSVGTWRLVQPGVIRIEYTDHEPKEYGGQPIAYPTGETVTFSVVNRNELNTSGGTIVREQ